MVNYDTPRQYLNYIWTDFWYLSTFGVTWPSKWGCYEELTSSQMFLDAARCARRTLWLLWQVNTSLLMLVNVAVCRHSVQMLTSDIDCLTVWTQRSSQCLDVDCLTVWTQPVVTVFRCWLFNSLNTAGRHSVQVLTVWQSEHSRSSQCSGIDCLTVWTQLVVTVFRCWLQILTVWQSEHSRSSQCSDVDCLTVWTQPVVTVFRYWLFDSLNTAGPHRDHCLCCHSSDCDHELAESGYDMQDKQ